MAILDGQAAVVTGAGTGIGVSIARQLARAGANVVVSAFNSFEDAEKLAAELEKGGRRAIAVKSDFRTAGNAREVVRACLDSFGRLDILVNNAGYTLSKPFVECSERDWDELFNINLKAMFVACSAAVPHMIQRRYGRIINISSVHGAQHMPGLVLYGATKGGINEFTRALAVELGEHGITANAIAPGAIYVPRYDRTGLNLARMAGQVPTGTLGEVDDIGRAALYLASPDSTYVNGAVLYVDGGLTAQMSLRAIDREG